MLTGHSPEQEKSSPPTSPDRETKRDAAEGVCKLFGAVIAANGRASRRSRMRMIYGEENGGGCFFVDGGPHLCH